MDNINTRGDMHAGIWGLDPLCKSGNEIILQQDV